VRSSLLIFLILNKTVKKFVTCHGYCHSLDGATLLSKVDSNKLRGYVKNEVSFVCARFGADLINSSKVTSHTTKSPRFLSHTVLDVLTV